MNLVSFALRRPITILVLAIAVMMTGLLAIERMPRDVFPNLGVPVLYVAQPYGGMDPAQMEGFIVNYYEYHFLYITGIEHVESKSIQGVALVKLQFHPGTDMAQATAETVAYVDRASAFMPAGTVPPFVMRFDGGSVPVGDLVLSSGLFLGLDLGGDERGQVGHSARDSAPLLDLTTGGEVDPRPFWDPVYREAGDRLVFESVWAEDLFEEETVRRLGRWYVALLSEVVAVVIGRPPHIPKVDGDCW